MLRNRRPLISDLRDGKRLRTEIRVLQSVALQKILASRVPEEPTDPVIQENWMHPMRWIPPCATSLLDVGCNAGELLNYCRDVYPTMRLSGVEVNGIALEKARRNLPEADLHLSEAARLPFA